MVLWICRRSLLRDMSQRQTGIYCFNPVIGFLSGMKNNDPTAFPISFDQFKDPVQIIKRKSCFIFQFSGKSALARSRTSDHDSSLYHSDPFNLSLTVSRSLQVRRGINSFISSMLLFHHLKRSRSSISSSSKRFRRALAGFPTTMV